MLHIFIYLFYNIFNLNCGDMMKCESCGKTLNNEPIAFCEKCEKYYCMNCYTKHRNHEINFHRITNDKLTRINTGIRGAGLGDTRPKFHTDEKWVLRHELCEHAKEEMESGKVIFYCEDGKIRCSKCFYESEFNNADPIIKIDNKLMYLLTHTFDPQNLEFRIKCDDEGIKGENVNLNLTIINNKIHDIKDINIKIEAFAAEPISENTSVNIYRERVSPKYLILKTLDFDTIKSKEEFEYKINIRIPEDDEIKEFQIINSDDGCITPDNVKNKTLKIPDNLMFYAQFTYKTFSGFQYWSYVETDIVKVKQNNHNSKYLKHFYDKIKTVLRIT